MLLPPPPAFPNIFSQFIWPGASKNYTLQCIVTSSHQVQAGFNIPNCCQVRGLLGLHDHDWQKILVLPKIIPPLPSTSSQFIWCGVQISNYSDFSQREMGFVDKQTKTVWHFRWSIGKFQSGGFVPCHRACNRDITVTASSEQQLSAFPCVSRVIFRCASIS